MICYNNNNNTNNNNNNNNNNEKITWKINIHEVTLIFSYFCTICAS